MVNSTHSRILVVDDERLVADTLNQIFKNKGFESTAVYSGEEAVQTAQWFQPDLIVLDLIMGRMNGVEVANEIASQLPQCRILVFSGNLALASLLADARSAEFSFDLMIKPVHPEVLLARLEEMGVVSQRNCRRLESSVQID